MVNPIEKQPPEWMKNHPLVEYPRAYTLEDMTVLRAKEDGRWHLSISHPDRLPTWEEIKDAKQKCLPGRVNRKVHFCLPVPPKEYWLNLHPRTMHIWELQDEHLIEQIEAEVQS